MEFFADGSIGLLHVDGNHSAEVSMRYVGQWGPKVAPGGYLVMDDIDWASQAGTVALIEASYEPVRKEASWAIYRKAPVAAVPVLRAAGGAPSAGGERQAQHRPDQAQDRQQHDKHDDRRDKRRRHVRLDRQAADLAFVERLQRRGEDSADVIEVRLKNAAVEVAQASQFDFVIINELFERALFDLKAVVHAQRLKYPAQRRARADVFDALHLT